MDKNPIHSVQIFDRTAGASSSLFFLNFWLYDGYSSFYAILRPHCDSSTLLTLRSVYARVLALHKLPVLLSFSSAVRLLRHSPIVYSQIPDMRLILCCNFCSRSSSLTILSSGPTQIFITHPLRSCPCGSKRGCN